MMLEALHQGNTVQIKSGGRSLEPLVYAGDTCFFDPIIPGHNIMSGDIVFCRVLPRMYYFVHLVWRVEKKLFNGVLKDTFWIGNYKDGDARRCNGWTHREFIYGILTKAQQQPFVARRVDIEPPEHQYNS